MYDYGNCFQFNSGLNFSNQKIDLVQSERLDRGYGLNLQLGYSFWKEIPSGVDNVRFVALDFLVFVHNSSNIISSSIKPVSFASSSKLVLSFKRVLISKEPVPYSECIDLSSYSSVLYDYIVKANYSYRQIDCLDLCIQQKILSECGCFSLKYPSLNTQMSSCFDLTQFECANNATDNFESSECIKNYCPLECSSIDFEQENSIGSVYSEPYYQKFFGANYISPTSLTASYSTLEYIQVIESPQTTFISLLTQLGGSLGMFVSFSVFTLFESIEFVVLIFHAFFCKRSKKQKVNPI